VEGEIVELIPVQTGRPEYFPLEPLDLEDRNLETDTTGSYRIVGIPPGHYLISVGEDIPALTGTAQKKYGGFTASNRITGRVWADRYFEQTFYPGVTDKAQAESIEVQAGCQIGDLNFKLGRAFRAYAASGRVINAETGEPMRECHLEIGHKTAHGFQGTYSLNGPSDTDDDGRFRIDGLIPGQFRICAHFGDKINLYTWPVEFEVKGDDVLGLEVKAHPGLTLSGSVFVDDGNDEINAMLSGLKLSATIRGENGGYSRDGAVNSDGSFKITGLLPGPIGLSISFWSSDSDIFQARIADWDKFSILRTEYPTAVVEENQRKVWIEQYPDRFGYPFGSILIVLQDNDLD